MIIVEDGDDAIGEILFLLDFRVIAVVFDFLDAFSPPFVFGEFDAHGCDVGVGDVVHVFRHVDIEELGEKIEILIGAVADDIVFELFERFGERVFAQFLVAFLIIFFHDNGVLENLVDIKSVEAIDGFGFEAVDSAGVFLGVLETAVTEERCHSFDVGTLVEDVDSERVAGAVPGDVLFDACAFDPTFDRF